MSDRGISGSGRAVTERWLRTSTPGIRRVRGQLARLQPGPVVRNAARISGAVRRRWRNAARDLTERAVQRVIPAFVPDTPVSAEASVLDGRTLQLSGTLEASQAETDHADLVFRRREGASAVLNVVPLTVTERRFSVTVPLDEGGIDLAPGSTSDLLLRVADRELPIRHVRRSSAAGPVEPNPLSPLDGLRRSPEESLRGTLRVRVSGPTFGVQVDRVHASFGHVDLVARALIEAGDEPVEVAFRQRGGGLSLRQTLDVRGAEGVLDGRVSIFTFGVVAPLSELSELAAGGGPIDKCVWDLDLVTSNHRLPFTKFLDDLREPRLTFRYPTVVLTTSSSRDRFRPYWTRSSNLSVEHLVSPRG